MKDRRPLILYILSLLIFGTNGVVVSFISLNSVDIVLARTLLGGILLLALFLLSKRHFSFYTDRKKLILHICSGVAMGTSWLFLFKAYECIGVCMATLIYYTGPVFVMILSPLFFKEKLTPIKILSFLIVFAGFFLINGSQSGALNGYGVFCALMSAVLYASLIILNKKTACKDGLENTTIQMAVGFIVAVIYKFIITRSFSYPILSTDILPLLILCIINTALACYMYFSSITKLPAQKVSVFGYLDPMSAVIFAFVFLGERLTVLQWIGTVFIIGGAMLGELLSIKRKAS